jgi:ABC-2 type transport system permease protein
MKLRVLAIELRKIIWYRAFWLSALAYLILMPLFFISLANLQLQLGGPGGTQLGINLYLFPQVWHHAAYMAGWFNLLLYFFLILLVTNEFQFRTLRQNIIDGMSREEVLLGKLLLILIFTLVSTILVALVAFGCGLVYGDGFQFSTAFEKWIFIPAFFLQCLATLVFALFVSLIVQKQGLTIIVYLFYVLVIENVLRFKLLPKGWGDYLPMKTVSDLIANPFPALMGWGKAQTPEWGTVVLVLGYTLLWLGLSWAWLRWRDL